MGEFRIGRTRAQHSYPENPRAAALGLFARNFASGPEDPTQLAVAQGDGAMGGTQIFWGVIGAGTAPSVNVTITPRVTGLIRVSGVVTVGKAVAFPVNILVQVQLGVDGGVSPLGGRMPVPLLETSTLDAAIATGLPPPIPADLGSLAIPIYIPILPVVLAIGVTRTIQIVVSVLSAGGTGTSLILGSSTIEVQEVPAATG